MNTKSRKQKLIAEINITPFTDVILVLLIIFMITTPLIVESSIKVNRPTAASAKPVKNVSKIYITITEDNLVYLDNKLVTKQALRDKVNVMYKDNPDLEVMLVSDKSVRFKDIVSVLDILNELGIKNFNIAAAADR